MWHTKVLWMVGVTLLAAACWAQAPAAAQQDPEAMARAFMEELSAGRFEQAAARFDERMSQLMPATKLAEAWQQVTSMTGAFREVTGATRSEQPGLQIIVLTCRFEKATWDTRVVVDAKGRVAGLWFGPAQQKQPPWTPAASVKRDAFDERNVTIGNDRWALPGTLSLPKGKGPFPGVVLVHGSGPNDEDETIGANKPFKDLAWGLATRGVAVLRYVKRSKKYPQEMSTLPNVTVKEQVVEDAQRGVELLVGQAELDAKQIYVLGHSLGASLAPRIAAGDKSVAGIVLLAGSPRPLEDLVVEQVKYLANLDGSISEAEQKQIEAAERFAQEVRSAELTATQQVKMFGIPMPGSYYLDLRNYRGGEVAAALRIPILVLQGERDYQVRMVDFEGWKKALSKRRNTAFKSYPALNHLFIAGSGPSSPAEYAQPGHVADEVIQDIAEWILARGRKSPGPQPKK
jgi:dienelactone hydrolase